MTPCRALSGPLGEGAVAGLILGAARPKCLICILHRQQGRPPESLPYAI